jgi:hypothetical protein
MVDSMYSRSIILLLLASVYGCAVANKSVSKNETSVKSELAYINLIEKEKWPVHVINQRIYRKPYIETNTFCEEPMYGYTQNLPIDSFTRFDFLTGVEKMGILGEVRKDVISQFKSSYECYYIGSIAPGSMLILFCNKLNGDVFQKVYLFTINDDKEVVSIAYVAHLLDFSEHISKAVTKITDSNRFEYIEEEVLSDVTIIGGQEEENIPVIFEIDKNGWIQIVK